MTELLKFTKKNYLIKFFAVTILLLVFIEASSFIFVRFVYSPKYPHHFRFDYQVLPERVSESHIKQFERIFHPTLGWNYPPGMTGGSPETGCMGRDWRFAFDEIGSRVVPVSSRANIIDIYGGSYTFGAEVNNDETWQYYLSKLTDSHVRNFGVGMYGMDQALLKLEANLERGIKAPVVVFGVYSAGILRIVNTHPPFRTASRATMLLAFKPILVKRENRYHWEAGHMMDSLDGLDTYRNSFETAKKDDYWYNLNEAKPKIGFPYTATVIQLMRYILFVHFESGNLWEIDAGAERFRFIVRRIVELSNEFEFVPVLVFIPQVGEMDEYEQGKPSTYENFYNSLLADFDETNLVLIDIFKEKFSPKEFVTWDEKFTAWDARSVCHPSPSGNRIIAESIFKRIGPSVEKLKKNTAVH